MEYTYELLETEFGSIVLRSDGACIPTDPANSDYQAYLAANSGSSVPNDPLATADSVSPSSIVP